MKFLHALIALFRQFPRLLTFIFLVCVGVIIYAASQYEGRFSNGSLSFEPKNHAQRGHIIGTGFYRDLKTLIPGGARETEIEHETLDLTIYQNDEVRGESDGPVYDQDLKHMVQKTFAQMGYKVGEYMFLSYRTTKEGAGAVLPQGSGAYVLYQSDTTFFGELIMRDKRGITLRCPYVLVTNPEERNVADSDAAERWPILKRDCVDVDFSNTPPQAVSPPTPLTPAPFAPATHPPAP